MRRSPGGSGGSRPAPAFASKFQHGKTGRQFWPSPWSKYGHCAGCRLSLSVFFVSGHPNSTQWIALLGFLALGSLAFIWLLWSFAGKSRLELDPIELKIVRQIFGIKLDTRAYRTREVRNLRY